MSLKSIPKNRAREVCIARNEPLRKMVEEASPKDKIVLGLFDVVADSNRRMEKARRIEQAVLRKRKVRIARKMLLLGRERLSEKERHKAMSFWLGILTLRAFTGLRKREGSSTGNKVDRKQPGS